MHCLEVEVPAISAFSLAQVVQEQASPFGADHSALQLVADCSVGPADVEIAQSSEAVSQFSEVLMIVLIHGG